MKQLFQRQLAKILKKQKVVFAYLFGSQAKDEAGPLSDIDLAVYLDEKVPRREYFDIKLELIGEFMDLFKSNDIDVVILNEAPPLLSHRILKEGKVIYSQDEKKRIFYETKAFMRYFDWDYFEEKFTQRILRT